MVLFLGFKIGYCIIDGKQDVRFNHSKNLALKFFEIVDVRLTAIPRIQVIRD